MECWCYHTSFPMAMGHWGQQAQAAGALAEPPGHVGHRRGLVEEHQAFRLEGGLAPDEGMARLGHVRTLLLDGVEAFFPDRQSSLCGGILGLEATQVGLGIAPEAAASGPLQAASPDVGPQGEPAGSIDPGQIGGLEWRETGDHPGDQTGRTADHGGRGGGAPTGRAPLTVAVGAEQPFQRVVGARQISDGMAVEQAGAIAAGYLEEVTDRLAQPAGPRAVPGHRAAQAVQSPGHCRRWQRPGVPDDVRRPVYPAERPGDVRPQMLGVAQGTADQPAQRLDLPVVPPFAATRCRLSDTASSRAFSVSPAASSGARPSAPRTLRTAAQ